MKKIVVIAVSIFFALQVKAQTGKIDGTVLNLESGLPLVGASLILETTNNGTATNDLGKFSIKNLDDGLYKLYVSFIGFEKITKEVKINKGGSANLILEMAPSAISLSDVEVTPNIDHNSSMISKIDIGMRPIKNSQDVLKIVPGLFIAQHAGGGKAEQIFLRGFDIDHGTDIALSVDGMPVNMVSHAHGQGYSDLHFVIPETIQRVAFDKGPYYANKGNFNTAGFADFHTQKRLDRNLFKIEGGQFGTLRTVGMINLIESTSKNAPSLYLASEYYRSNGYFESSQNFNRFNALIKYHQKISDNQILEVSGSSFTSKWNASGQIPTRAVKSGQITRFGAIDDTEGGETSRMNFNTNLITYLSDGGMLQNQAYFTNYDFNLVSNFTFFLNDPINGDQITQSENRQIYGVNNSYLNNWQLFGFQASTEFGAGIRHDVVNDIRLSRTLNKETILSDLSFGNLKETNVHIYMEEVLAISPKISLTTGLRYDYFNFNYKDALSFNPNYQTESKGLISPKAQLGYKVGNRLSLYAKTGVGFHSNDTRVVVAQRGEQILPKAHGLDIGVLWKPNNHLLINLALWKLNLEQEFVYVGDEGVVEAGGRTQRKGIDLTLRYQLTPWLNADMDFNFTDPKAKDELEGQQFIPLAPTFTSIGGISFKSKRGLTGSLRYRYLGNRPANETNSLMAKGYFLMDAMMNYRIGRLNFGMSIENLLNREWNEAQFETESRLRNESVPISEIHFTPGTPFQARFSIEVNF